MRRISYAGCEFAKARGPKKASSYGLEVVTRSDEGLAGLNWTKLDHEAKRPDRGTALESWRPRRDSNPRYRRERDAGDRKLLKSRARMATKRALQSRWERLTNPHRTLAFIWRIIFVFR